jgi:hypothetical protein
LLVHAVALVGPVLLLELILTKLVALPARDYLALTAVGLGSSLFMFSVWHRTKQKFIWFAVSAFVAIGVFQGFSTYFRTRDSPKIEPMAAITNVSTPVVGYYIAQTSDRIYVGLPARGKQLPARMLALHRDQVKAIVIGRLTPVAGATKVGREFARDLVASVAEPNKPAAPSLTAASLSNRRFRVVGGRPSVSAKRFAQGTVVRFTLSAPATLRIAIARRVPGLRRGRKCVNPTRRLRRARLKRCTRSALVGTLTRSVEPKGADRIALTGGVGRRQLGSGAYKAVLSASNTGGHSKPVSLNFVIVR